MHVLLHKTHLQGRTLKEGGARNVLLSQNSRHVAVKQRSLTNHTILVLSEGGRTGGRTHDEDIVKVVGDEVNGVGRWEIHPCLSPLNKSQDIDTLNPETRHTFRNHERVVSLNTPPSETPLSTPP